MEKLDTCHSGDCEERMMTDAEEIQDDDTKSFDPASVEFEATDDAFARTDDYGALGRA